MVVRADPGHLDLLLVGLRLKCRVLEHGRERVAQRLDARRRHAWRQHVRTAVGTTRIQKLEQLMVGFGLAERHQRHVGDFRILLHPPLQQHADFSLRHFARVLTFQAAQRVDRAAVDFAGRHRHLEHHAGGRIAGHDLELGAEDRVGHQREIDRCAARGRRADDELAVEQLIERLHRRFVGDHDQEGLGAGAAEPTELPRIELRDAGRDQRAGRRAADAGADHRAVARR